MYETVISLKPKSEWRKGMTVDSLTDQMNEALTIPGLANAFTMPIKARIDMLSTGIRTPLGIKVLGPGIEETEKIGLAVEQALKGVAGTRSVYAERITTGYFLDFNIDRDESARFGLNIDDVQDVIESATGGINLTTTVEGRERYPVNVRYARELRDSIDALKRVPVLLQKTTLSEGIPDIEPGTAAQYPTSGKGSMSLVQVPLAQLAEIKVVKGPTVIQSEAGLILSRVFVDVPDRDMGSYVAEAKKKLASLSIPKGYRFQWSGEYEHLEKTYEGLRFILPLTLFLIFALIYFNTKSVVKTMIVLLAVPFSLVGSFWLLYILQYHMSTAVWVGLIALAGLDAETGVVMLLYLDLAHEKWRREGRLNGLADLRDAVKHGAVKRIRPKVMTVSVILAGLIPIMFSDGAGSDVMKRIAAPMIGGVVTSLVLELIIYPVLFILWKGREFRMQQEASFGEQRGRPPYGDRREPI
jgi:copper/silver efflux system protein